MMICNELIQSRHTIRKHRIWHTDSFDNPLKPSFYYMYHLLQHAAYLLPDRTAYLYVCFGSKQSQSP
jgi:hypothetical protein